MMKTLIKLSTSGFILLLTNCAEVSTAKHSELAVSEKSLRGPKLVNNQQDVSRILWWKKMRDPSLNHLIEEALTNNNDIYKAQANIVQAQAQLKAAHLAWLPTLGLSGSGFLGKGWDTHVTPQGALANSIAFPSSGTLKIHGAYGGFVPSYSLNILGNVTNSKLANASLEIQKASYQATRLSIISQTSGAYFTLLGQRKQLAMQQQLINHLKKLRRLEAVRHRDGASDLTALTSIDQEISDNLARLSSIENSCSQVENTIQLLTNHNPGPVTINSSLSTPITAHLIPSHISSEVLKNRPDIIIAYENLNAADAHLGIAYADLFPNLSLTGLLGESSIELIHLLKLSTAIGIAQTALSIPLINLAAYQKIQAAKAGTNVAFYNYLQTVRSALVDVDNSLTKAQKMNKAYSNQQDALTASQRAFRINLAKYKSGAQDYRGVINAQIKLDQAELNLIFAKMDQLNSIVEVYQALAGGYKEVENNDILLAKK